MKLKLIGAALLLAMSSMANATVIPFGPASASGNGPVISFMDLATVTGTYSDATITVNINGDLDSVSEYVDVDFDGLSLGRILNNDSSDDEFDFAGDAGNQSQSTITGVATIDQATFAGLIADGDLDLSFDTSYAVGCCGTINHLSGTIAFEGYSAVSEPGTIALLGLGILGLGMARRRVK